MAKDNKYNRNGGEQPAEETKSTEETNATETETKVDAIAEETEVPAGEGAGLALEEDSAESSDSAPVPPAEAPVEVSIPESPAPVATAPVEQVATDALITPEGRVNLPAVRAKLSIEGRTILARLVEYMEIMAPGHPVTVDQGARQQVLLYRAIVQIIDHLEGPEFNLMFAVLLALFAEHADGVFHPSAVFRYPEFVKLSAPERKAQLGLLNLLVKLGPHETRDVMIKQLDVARSIESGITERGRGKIAAFFNI